VVDASYPNLEGFFAPYKETWYHVPKFRRTGRAHGKKRCSIMRTPHWEMW